MDDGVAWFGRQHGRISMVSRSDEPSLADYALVNAPDPYFTGFSWFDIQGDHEEGIARNRQLLFQTIEKVCETEGIEPFHLFMFGFSQGLSLIHI